MKDNSEYKYAGFWMRVAAMLTDMAMLGFALGLISVILGILVIILTSVTLGSGPIKFRDSHRT